MPKVRILSTALVVVLLLAFAGSASANSARNFRAHLSSDEEVAAVPVESLAQGQAIFQLSRDGTELEYKLIASNIDNILMAHIHMGASGANGPVVVWLYPEAPPPQLIPGRSDGVLAEGTITAGDLVGPLAGRPLSDLLGILQTGGAYVNVHTSQYTGGEIRGQVH